MLDLETSVQSFQHLIIMGRQMRNDIKVKLKTPLRQATVLHRDKTVLDDIQRLSDYIKAELNFKSLNFSTEEGNFIDLYAKANFPALGKRLGKHVKHYAALLLTLHQLILINFSKLGF